MEGSDEIKNSFEKLDEKLTNNIKEEIEGIKNNFQRLDEKLMNHWTEEIDEPLRKLLR